MKLTQEDIKKYGTKEEIKEIKRFTEDEIYGFYRKAIKYLEFNVSHKEYETALHTVDRIKQHIEKMKERQQSRPVEVKVRNEE